MYLIKKNALNIIITVLIFGVIGTLINLIIPAHSYEYEEYYTLDGDVSPNTAGELNIQLNTDVNSRFSEKAVSVTGNRDSNIIRMDISTSDRDQIAAIRSEANDVIAEQNYMVSGTDGAATYQVENTILKMSIIILSLFTGLIVGLVVSLLNRNISTEEDFEHYLGEKTLGTF